MRVVADTNVVVSGLLWHGPLREILDALARERKTENKHLLVLSQQDSYFEMRRNYEPYLYSTIKRYQPHDDP